MKTIFRFLSVGMLLMAFIAVGTMAGFAQSGCDDAAGKADLDGKFRSNYGGDHAARKIAVDAGKQYIEKYGECPDSKEFVDYLKSYLPGMEKRLHDEDAKTATDQLYGRFNKAFNAGTWDDVYAAGKDILAKEPDNLDVIITLGSIGYDQTLKKNFKVNDDTIRYAKLAIQKINEGKTSEHYGLKYPSFNYQYGTKENALGWMNLNIGYIMFYGQNNKKDAVPYLYAATQSSGETKTRPDAFEPIGAYYFDDVKKLADEVQTMIKEQQSMPATATDEEKAKKDADIKAKIALLNGTAERAMDAYSRAYTLAKANPKTATYAAGLYKQLQALYNVRFQKTDGLDAYIASTVAKPMPDPTSPVTPVSDPEPTTATTPVKPAAVVAPPAATTKTSPAASKAVAPADNTTKTTTATTKKPVVVKKKGTR